MNRHRRDQQWQWRLVFAHLYAFFLEKIYTDGKSRRYCGRSLGAAAQLLTWQIIERRLLCRILNTRVPTHLRSCQALSYRTNRHSGQIQVERNWQKKKVSSPACSGWKPNPTLPLAFGEQFGDASLWPAAATMPPVAAFTVIEEQCR